MAKASEALRSSSKVKSGTASLEAPENSSVNLVCGSHDLNVDVVGLTVLETQMAFTEILNLPQDLQAFVNGRQISDISGHKLQHGDRLEFMLLR